ncbi:LysM peptidoglycan-binding domain-containing protein [Sporosarcina ureilytica]|uniref:Peptidoglycan endopeptidase n=1 Tax=Sporosarcina ureilytica TaxID=298596 RepID=A0A1D8JJ58_9BACL|nr:peptidoglycan endopeptidase [Sporosarcina ureilytica]AOV08754.1 hypothetical protein BI350_15185 [Sporosarcina ureilytica]
MKKIAFSVVATGSLAFFVGTGDAEASSYQVKAGDSLWKIASSNQVSVADIKKWNGLTSDVIYPNQVLQVNSTASVPVKQTESRPSATPTTTSTYTVKSGDTLSQIAQRHNTTVGAIQRLNNITGHLIFAGQQLKVSGTSPQTSTNTRPSSTPPTTAVPSASTGSHTVVRGDTLSGIAHQHGITVTQLQNWNNIQSHLIYVGQVLKVENTVVAPQKNPPAISTAPPPAQAATGSVKSVIHTAMPLQGTPYTWGGSTPNGFDCSGFIYYVYSQAGVDVPRTNTVGFDARTYEVDKPQVGDLVFFKNTYTTGISHAGIYIGDNKFIHAGGDRVQVTSLSDPYWSKHFDSFKRLYAMN